MSVNYCNQSCEFAFRGKRKTSVWIRRTAAAEGWETGAVSVVFCSDEALLEINRRYLKHDYYTDIITFDYSDPDKRTIAGDLMISVDTVRDNARELGVPVRKRAATGHYSRDTPPVRLRRQAARRAATDEKAGGPVPETVLRTNELTARVRRTL